MEKPYLLSSSDVAVILRSLKYRKEYLERKEKAGKITYAGAKQKIEEIIIQLSS